MISYYGCKAYSTQVVVICYNKCTILHISLRLSSISKAVALCFRHQIYVFIIYKSAKNQQIRHNLPLNRYGYTTYLVLKTEAFEQNFAKSNSNRRKYEILSSKKIYWLYGAMPDTRYLGSTSRDVRLATKQRDLHSNNSTSRYCGKKNRLKR